MKRHLLLSAVLSALVVVLLSACGGDDNKDNDDAQTRIVTATTPGPTAPADKGATGATGKQTKSGSKKKRKKSEKAETKAEQGLDPGADFNAKDEQDKLSYAAAKQVCRERKLDDLKASYKPKGTSPEAIAKAVSVGYQPKHRANAAYRGCLAGLKQR